MRAEAKPQEMPRVHRGTNHFLVLVVAAAARLWFRAAAAPTSTFHDMPDPAADPRRTVAERTMSGFGAAVGATEVGLMAAASSYPVHNPHTAYTAYMRAATGHEASIHEASKAYTVHYGPRSRSQVPTCFAPFSRAAVLPSWRWPRQQPACTMCPRTA